MYGTSSTAPGPPSPDHVCVCVCVCLCRFTHESPGEAKDGILSVVNPVSSSVLPSDLVEARVDSCMTVL